VRQRSEWRAAVEIRSAKREVIGAGTGDWVESRKPGKKGIRTERKRRGISRGFLASSLSLLI
jgi:hypothetical protein